MARTRSMSSIDTEIEKIQTELDKLQKCQDTLTERLLELQQQKQEYEVKQIAESYRKSGKSLDELLTFLDV